MKRIEKVAVIGMGALGLLFGDRIHESLGDDNFAFLMDEERASKHRADIYKINGEEKHYPIATPSDLSFVPDLIIFATKFGGLESAGELAKRIAGPETVYIAVLNGIISEEILGRFLPSEKIVDCVAIGMDAMRDGTDLDYKSMGNLQIGISQRGCGGGSREGTEATRAARVQEEAFASLKEFFDRVGVPYEVPEDIRRSMWIKFMMNVGINQACMVYECPYKDALSLSHIYDDLYDSMHEVMAIGKAEGINISEEDYDRGIAIFHTLHPDSYPSMRQDALAKRKSEVDLFAGTVMNIAKKHGIPVPVNERFYNIIKEMEAKY